ncbi:MAG: 50S ribosomal protein L24 [Candidatus Ancaeobacter aquaticus]|nr:50S ribosomal protein L24 [Candidatus Ancaeobacter aquaticus]
MIKTKIKKDDTVVAIKGKDNGKTGRVLHVFYKTGKVLVEGINFVKKTSRPNRNNPQGGIINVERPLPLSNVMFYCGKCKTGVRVSIRALGSEGKERFCKKCEETI